MRDTVPAHYASLSYRTSIRPPVGVRPRGPLPRLADRRTIGTTGSTGTTLTREARRASSQREGEWSGDVAVSRRRSKRSTRPRIDRTELSSFHMLDFPALCRQVASFASTPAAAEKAFKGRLEVGQTREASEALQEQTREALSILDGVRNHPGVDPEDLFVGVMDLRRALDAVERDGVTLHPLVIGAVATSVEATVRLHERLVDLGSPLAELLADLMRAENSPLDISTAIREKISVVDGLILSTASESLGEIRALKDDNAAELQKQADKWSRDMYACGAAERAQVVIRRDRRCIPIKAGRNGELPPNSVVLGTSGSQATMYMEPAPMIPLNNFNIELIEAEENEQEAILRELSDTVAKRAQLLRRMGAAVVRIDLAFARAKHAKWVGGILPQFCDEEVRFQEVLHPLLLQEALPPLAVPRLPARRTSRLGAGAMGGISGVGSSALEGIDLVPELWDREHGERGVPKSRAGTNRSREDDPRRGATTTSPAEVSNITPISILIPQGKRAVVVTGPNTGGKTASLKTFGLLSLMAKAGLAIPVGMCEKSETSAISADMSASAAASGSTCLDRDSNEGATNEPRCMWFDKVLVDVGDSQSLQQNLSTFSGHMTRISKILESATPQSLVLLDEVGSGTDPAEGAALATAIIGRLAHGGAAMTYVTTHHAELKEIKDPVFLDANVEFDVRTLLPTYKISWGSSGESHALAVAEGLGFDPLVVAAAREVARGLKEERDEEKRTNDAAAMLKQSLPGEIALAESRIQAAEMALKEQHMLLGVLGKELDDVQAQEKALESNGNLDSNGSFGDAAIRTVLRDARAGTLKIADAEKKLRAIAGEARESAELALADVFSDDRTDGGWVPGDRVAVLTMGGAQATVISVNQGKQTASVRAGMMEIGDVSFANLRKADPGRAARDKKKDGDRGNNRAFSRASKGSSTDAQMASRSASVATVQQQPAIQTSQNTVDLRGMTAEEARHEVEAAVGSARAGAVLFVIHGVGTGKVRTSVLQSLRKNKRVRKTEQQEGSNGGCAVVYVS